MSVERLLLAEDALRNYIQNWVPASGTWQRADLQGSLVPGMSLSCRRGIEIFESQLASRMLDRVARELRAKGQGFYTISSAGHEGNAALAAVLRATDPAFLHYRSAAFMVERARAVPGQTPIFDTCLSLVASSDDPISGGRHKVFGSAPLWVPPQTSTIASHLPKAVGMAFSIERSWRAQAAGEHLCPLPRDAIVVVSFGDASANHSTALGAVNTALWTAFQGLPVPILFVCEDNGLGLSVPTPTGWIESVYGSRPGLHYVQVNGLDLASAYEGASAAVAKCRELRQPTFLHMKTVRLFGHAGSDTEQAYRAEADIRESEEHDPLLRSAMQLLEARALTSQELLDLMDETYARVTAAAQEAVRRPKLSSASEVTAALIVEDEGAVLSAAGRPTEAPVSGGPKTLARLLNAALAEGLARYPEMVVFGEDVGRKGGVYGITQSLQSRFGKPRVFSTLLDEQAILGQAIGSAMLGLLPVPEIQYLAYLHNAEDQLRGEAASLQFFSCGQFQNPMVVRIASYGYQKGFGGHFHNDNSVAVLRDIPGLVIASPARGEDAVGMMRTCLALALATGRVVAFLEPIALYHTRDLHEESDGGWLDAAPDPDYRVPLGSARLYLEEGRDLTIISYANGLFYSLQAAHALAQQGVTARVLDLRWLAPLDSVAICREARETGRVLVVDECRQTGSISEAIVTLLCEDGGEDGADLQIARVTGEDTSFLWELQLS